MNARLYFFLPLLCFTWVFFPGRATATTLDSAQAAFARQDYIDAMLLYQRWYDVTSPTNDSIYLSNVLDLVRCYRINGLYDKSLNLLKKVETFSAANNNEYFRLLALVVRGDVYRFVNQKLSLEYFRDLGPEPFLAYPDILVRYYHRAAAAYNEVHEEPGTAFLDTSYFLSLMANRIAKQYGYWDALATSYNELAAILEDKGDLANALLYVDSAISIFKEQNDIIDYVNANKNKSRFLFRIGLYDKAIANTHISLAITEQKDWFSYAYLHYDVIAKSYLMLGDSLNWMRYKIKDLEAYHRHFKKESKKEMLLYQVEYEVKEKEASLLRSKEEIEKERKQKKLLWWFFTMSLVLILIIAFLYQDIRKKNLKLNTLLSENEFLLGETNHRIKNNLQLITSLIARETNASVGSETHAKLKEIAKKIESMSALHQQLYKSDEKQNISSKKYLDEVIENFALIAQSADIKMHLEIEDFSLHVDKALYLGLLTTELLINTMKYAYPQEKKEKRIEIKLQVIDKACSFYYTDNGIGLGGGVKLKLVELIKSQLDGEHIISSSPGFEYSLRFPL